MKTLPTNSVSGNIGADPVEPPDVIPNNGNTEVPLPETPLGKVAMEEGLLEETPLEKTHMEEGPLGEAVLPKPHRLEKSPPIFMINEVKFLKTTEEDPGYWFAKASNIEDIAGYQLRRRASLTPVMTPIIHKKKAGPRNQKRPKKTVPSTEDEDSQNDYK
uniref:DUF4780 domain-containing protein n=1 Tax=Rhabditophanes sp. KR3021 TaxID=114890 RepID=A0AC35TYR6_9BILA